ncbi:hypothetical protein ACMFWY_12365 [Roseiconus sp. JC912]
MKLTQQVVRQAAAISGIDGNVDLTFELQLRNIGTDTLEQISLSQDFDASIGNAFVGIVSRPTKIPSEELHVVEMNPLYDGTFHSPLIVNASKAPSELAPGETLTLQLTIEVDPIAFGKITVGGKFVANAEAKAVGRMTREKCSERCLCMIGPAGKSGSSDSDDTNTDTFYERLSESSQRRYPNRLLPEGNSFDKGTIFNRALRPTKPAEPRPVSEGKSTHRYSHDVFAIDEELFSAFEQSLANFLGSDDLDQHSSQSKADPDDPYASYEASIQEIAERLQDGLVFQAVRRPISLSGRRVTRFEQSDRAPNADPEFVDSEEVTVRLQVVGTMGEKQSSDTLRMDLEVEIHNSSHHDLVDLRLTSDPKSVLEAAFLKTAGWPIVAYSTATQTPQVNLQFNGMPHPEGDEVLIDGWGGWLKPGEAFALQYAISVQLPELNKLRGRKA